MTQDILTQYAQIYVQLMRSLLPSVTGKTRASVRAEVRPNRLIGYARGFVSTIETGRGPRQSNTYSSFDKGLESWLKAKGFPTKKTKTGTTYYQIGGQWFSAKSLAWKINKEGDKTFRTGGKEVYSEALEKMVNELIKKVEADKLKEYRGKFVNMFHGSIGNQTA